MKNEANAIYLVYLGRDGIYKIGATRNLNKRLKSLSRGDPWLELIAFAETGLSWPETVEMERHLHHQFQQCSFEFDNGTGNAPTELFQFDDDMLESVVLHVGHCWDVERQGYLP
ncbi:MAG: GIY-YIG nuclease family protein [Anaerolineales bacterium]